MADRIRLGDDYRFYEPRDLGVFICTKVFLGNPVLYVTHDEEGDWQFLCGESHDEEAIRRGEPVVDDICVACLEHVVQNDGSLNELAELGVGYEAERRTRESPWVTRRLPASAP